MEPGKGPTELHCCRNWAPENFRFWWRSILSKKSFAAANISLIINISQFKRTICSPISIVRSNLFHSCMDDASTSDNSANTGLEPENDNKLANRRKRRKLYRAQKRQKIAQAKASLYDPLAGSSTAYRVSPASYVQETRFTPTLKAIEDLIDRQPGILTEPPPKSLMQPLRSVEARIARQSHQRQRINIPQAQYR